MPIRNKGLDVNRPCKKSDSFGNDRRFKDYYASNDLAQGMNSILAKARQAILINNFGDASAIVCTVLSHLVSETVPDIDDSSGYLGDTIPDAILLIKEITESEVCSSETKEDLFLFLNA